MKKSFLIFFFFPLIIFSQTKTWEEWKSDSDEYINNTSSGGKNAPGRYQYEAAVKSNSIMDMYYEGYGLLFGLYRMWQATGDFSYLDKALTMVEADMNGAVTLDSYFEEYVANGGDYRGGYLMPMWPYKGNLMLPNHFIDAPHNYSFPTDGSFSYYFPDLIDYTNHAVNQSYSYVEARDGNRYFHEPLGENIYYRFAADMLRVMHNNSSILPLTSGNGKTYQQRFDFILNYLEVNIYEKWVEQTNDQEKGWFVYRQNTHMSNHLASTALCLYVITGNQKYADFVNEYLYDFGSNPSATEVPNGVGFLDQIKTDAGGAKVWSSTWGSNAAAGGTAQDVAHAGVEFVFLTQCYQEGFGGIDDTFMEQLANTVKNNAISGDNSISYRLDSDQTPFSLKAISGSGILVMAEFDAEVLNWLENNTSSGVIKMSYYGHGAYAARRLGINGATSPVYPSDGIDGGAAPTNNCPNVTSTAGSNLELNVGDVYTEQGGTWTDIQDGNGEAIVGGDTVDTSNPGTYTVSYTYTDTDDCTDTATLTVRVNVLGNDCPVVTSTAGNSITLDLNDTYIEQGGTWEDTEDGSGVAIISGDTVDTSTAGTYIVSYSYEDTAQCSVIETLNVVVRDSSSDVLIESFNWDGDYATMSIGENGLPTSTIMPQNPTIPFIYVTSSDESIASVDENGFLTALKPGIITLTGTTLDGTNLSDTITIEVLDDRVLVESFNWNVPTYTMEVGDVGLPESTVNPSNANIAFIFVESSDETIADVNQNGFLVALRPGTITLTGTTLDGTNISDTAIVEVIESQLIDISLTVSNSTATEGESMNFIVSLNEPSEEEVFITISNSNGTADESDYTIITQELNFAPGETQKSIIVETLSDDIDEDDETFTLDINVKEPFEFAKGTITVTGTIQDNFGALEAEKSIKVFPNPAASSTPIYISGIESGTYNIAIYDLSGRLVNNELVDIDGNTIELITPSVSPGLYILNVINTQNTYVSKIIIR